LVLIHEFGHMVMAKRAGVRVEEFGVGYPPKILSLFKDKSGTEYSLNLLPFGGFVRLLGEEGEESGLKKTGKEFYTKSKKERLMIIMAGAVMNFLFGVVAFGAIYTKIGIPEAIGAVEVIGVAKNSPAETAGITVGDKVTGVYGDDFSEKTTDFITFAQATSKHAGEEVWISFERETAKYDTPVYVRKVDEIPEEEGAIGVTMKDTEFIFYPIWQRPFRGMWIGLQQAIVFGMFLVGALGTMLRDLFVSGVVPAEVAGPVGIGHAVIRNQLLTRDLISVKNINFAAVLSINLAIINMFPFPALDGGRVVFVLLEGVMRRRVKPVIERWANMAGFGLLLLLIVTVTFNDLKTILVEAGLVERVVDFVGILKK